MLVGKRIKEIRIIPKAYARFFEVQYTYETECIQRNLNPNHALAIDLGINNLMTCATSQGKSLRVPADSISEQGRAAQGVRVLDINQPDMVIGIDKIANDEN